MKNQQGASLVEMLVGLTVGLIVAATAAGTASFMEAQKKVSMGTNSALANGALGLFRIESETKLAGLGLMAKQNFACPSFNLSYNKQVRLDGDELFPVSIVDGGEDDSDSLTIAYLNSLTGASYAQVLLPMLGADSEVKLANAPDAIVGSVLLLQESKPGVPCTVVQVSGRKDSAFGADISHAKGAYNGGGFSNPVAYSEGSRASASRAFVWSTFRVRENTLEEVNNVTGEATPIADGIIAMRARYGTTDGSSTSVSSWQSATGAYESPAATDMYKVRAVRIGLVARSLDRDQSCSSTKKELTLWPDGPVVDVSAEKDWKCYKYRTFNMVVPLINVVMGLP